MVSTPAAPRSWHNSKGSKNGRNDEIPTQQNNRSSQGAGQSHGAADEKAGRQKNRRQEKIGMIEQIALAVLSLTACALSQASSDSLRRYACLFGLASQPFWIHATWASQQYGMVVISALYCIVWGSAAVKYWLPKTIT